MSPSLNLEPRLLAEHLGTVGVEHRDAGGGATEVVLTLVPFRHKPRLHESRRPENLT